MFPIVAFEQVNAGCVGLGNKMKHFTCDEGLGNRDKTAVLKVAFYSLDIFHIMLICDALGDLVQFAQFKKLEKHPSRGVTFSKIAG